MATAEASKRGLVSKVRAAVGQLLQLGVKSRKSLDQWCGLPLCSPLPYSIGPVCLFMCVCGGSVNGAREGGLCKYECRACEASASAGDRWQERSRWHAQYLAREG